MLELHKLHTIDVIGLGFARNCAQLCFSLTALNVSVIFLGSGALWDGKFQFLIMLFFKFYRVVLTVGFFIRNQN